MNQPSAEVRTRAKTTFLRNLLRLQALVLGSAAITAALFGPSSLAAAVLAVVAAELLVAAALRARRLLGLHVPLTGLQLVALGAGAAGVATGDGVIARGVLALLCVDGLVLLALQPRAARRARAALGGAPGVADEAPPIEVMERSRRIADGTAAPRSSR